MQVQISVFSSKPRDFTEAEHAALDAKSVEIDQETWDTLRLEYFNEQDLADDYPTGRFLRKVDNYIAHFERFPDSSGFDIDRINLAHKMRQLIDAGVEHGCDRIGIAG
jgi:hypothetical protein